MVICSQCGKESEGRFCPACGAPMPGPDREGTAQAPSTAVAGSGTTMTTAAPPVSAAASASPGKRRVPLWAILSAGAVVIALGVILVGLLTGGDDVDTAAPEALPPAEAVVDPHDVCTTQLVATVANLVDGNGSREVTVNGQNDPFYTTALGMVSVAVNDRYQVGDTKALENLRTKAGAVCTQVLHDAVRPNYPTDGSAP